MSDPEHVTEEKALRILLVEDDEDDYVLIRDQLRGIPSPRFELSWVRDYDAALVKMASNHHDICLLDYVLDYRSGLELLAEARERGMTTPAVLLSGKGNREVDERAMKAGVAEYLEKTDLSPALLERTIRYSVAHARATRDLQDLSQRLITLQEEERKHLARELHDTLGSSLVALKFALENEISAALQEQGASERVKRLQRLLDLVQQNIQETKRIQKDLRPSVLDDLGIKAAVKALCREQQIRYPGIRVDMLLQVQEEDVPEPLKITIYRILQEGLNNVAKHSRSASAGISLARLSDRIELEIFDEGSGFDLEHYRESRSEKSMMGITGMKERVRLSGGSFSLLTSPGKGTRLRASWPCSDQPR
jgi:signal transduction histidine kinase